MKKLYLLLASSLALSFCLQGTIKPQTAEAAFGLEDSPMDNRLAAMDQIHRGDRQAALESYSTAIESATKKFGANSTFLADLYYEAGSLASQMDQFETAENHLRKALQINPRLSMARIELANVCRRRDKPTEALEQIQRDLGNHPNSLIARQQFVRWLGQNGKTLTDKSIAHQESLRLLAISQSANLSMPGAVKAPPVTLPKGKTGGEKAAEEKAKQDAEKLKEEAEKAKADIEKSKVDAENAEKTKQAAFRHDLEERARKVERAARAEKDRLDRQERAARAEKAARAQKPVVKKPEAKPENKPEEKAKPEAKSEGQEQVAKASPKQEKGNPEKTKKVAAEQVAAPRQQAPAAVGVLPGMYIPVTTPPGGPAGKRSNKGLVPPPPASSFNPYYPVPPPMIPMPAAQQPAPKPKKEKPKPPPKKEEEEPEEKAAPATNSGAAPTDQDAEFMLDWAELKSKKGKGK